MNNNNHNSAANSEEQTATRSSQNTGTFGLNIPEVNIRTVLRTIIDLLQKITEKIADLFAYCLRMLVQSEYFIIF